MAFQPAIIVPTQSLIGSNVGAPGAAPNADASGLFQMLMAANSGGDIAAQSAAPTPNVFGGASAAALLLQSADPAPIHAPDAITDTATPSPFAMPAAHEPAAAPVLHEATSPAQKPNPQDPSKPSASGAIEQTPMQAQEKTAAPDAAPVRVALSLDAPAEGPAASAPAATQIVAASTPDAAQAILFAPFATPAVTSPAKAATPSVADAEGKPVAPIETALFDKPATAFAAAVKMKTGAGPASAFSFSAETAATASSPAHKTQADPLPGPASPISGFDAPRPASEVISAPVARAPHGAGATLQVVHNIVRNFNGKSANFDVRLEPAELGRVDVKITVDHDKRVTAHVSADNPQTLTDLRGAARDIERALSDAGLDVSQGGLSFDLNQRQAHDEGFDASPYAATDETAGEGPAAFAATPFGLQRWSASGVDVWA